MKVYYFGKVSLFVTGSLMYFVVSAHAQVQPQDSLHQTVSLQYATDDTHNLRLKNVLGSTALVGVSALFVHNGWLTGKRENVQDVISLKGKCKFKVDDYSQYAPMVTVYGLNLCGIRGKHEFKDRTIILAMSYATMGILVNTMKFIFKEKRPDCNDRNSFPSGHTATAFMGAEFLYEEYKDISPWIGYAGYTVAAATGYLRMYNNRHYINDVIAGACIGMTSMKLAYWLYPKCFKNTECNKATFAGMPYYASGSLGLRLCIVF